MPSVSLRRLLALLVTISLLSLAVACGSDDDEVEDDDTRGPTETAGTAFKPSGNEGAITGTVAFTGAAPAARSISMDADPACSSANPNAQAEDVVVHDGKLQNVFVYVKDGKTAEGKSLATFKFDPPAPEAVLDQQGCQYRPHVLGIMSTQKLKVTNSDHTTHNVNVQPKSNQGFNQAQSQGAPPITKDFPRAEVVIPIKCNQHPWMKSYLNVMRTPFFGLSGADGKFEIKNLPPGTYNVVAWHEKFGEKTMSVTVAAKETKTQDFAYDGAAARAGARRSLEVLPAIEFPMISHH
ncbi:MAG: carboxypeptidase regulatory-like domain-containing protein [Acidobacteria bacterium]|nr:carboxypeptidase regulatory-like domain-containing protein [Acidobacteriota bacterium]